MTQASGLALVGPTRLPGRLATHASDSLRAIARHVPVLLTVTNMGMLDTVQRRRVRKGARSRRAHAWARFALPTLRGCESFDFGEFGMSQIKGLRAPNSRKSNRFTFSTNSAL